MKPFTALELKLSAFIIGVLELIWGFVALMDSRGRVSMLMELYSVREEFGLTLLLSALLLLTGSVFPCRNVRHWGLIICPLVTFPVSGFALTNNIINVGSLALPFLGAMALLILWFDVRGKPRAKLD